MKSTKKNRKKGGTGEWADDNFNVRKGCTNGCLYCYGCSFAVRFHRVVAGRWVEEIAVADKKIRRFKGRVMIPSTHDITPHNISVVLPYIQKLLEAGNTLLIVSKPHLECVKAMCTQLSRYKDKIVFRFTIGSPDSKVLQFWEPNAPAFGERLNALKHAFNEGFQTSVSMEPMLDTIDNMKALVKQVTPFVTDSIWLGKPRNLVGILKLNNTYNDKTAMKVVQFKEWYCDENIIALYKELRANKIIKWKDSIKKVVGLKISKKVG